MQQRICSAKKLIFSVSSFAFVWKLELKCDKRKRTSEFNKIQFYVAKKNFFGVYGRDLTIITDDNIIFMGQPLASWRS